MKTIRPLLIALFIAASLRAGAQTVYITASGKKYHSKNCTAETGKKKPVELAEAKRLGYQACTACRADTIREMPKKPAPKKTAGLIFKPADKYEHLVGLNAFPGLFAVVPHHQSLLVTFSAYRKFAC